MARSRLEVPLQEGTVALTQPLERADGPGCKNAILKRDYPGTTIETRLPFEARTMFQLWNKELAIFVEQQEITDNVGRKRTSIQSQSPLDADQTTHFRNIPNEMFHGDKLKKGIYIYSITGQYQRAIEVDFQTVNTSKLPNCLLRRNGNILVGVTNGGLNEYTIEGALISTKRFPQPSSINTLVFDLPDQHLLVFEQKPDSESSGKNNQRLVIFKFGQELRELTALDMEFNGTERGMRAINCWNENNEPCFAIHYYKSGTKKVGAVDHSFFPARPPKPCQKTTLSVYNVFTLEFTEVLTYTIDITKSLQNNCRPSRHQSLEKFVSGIGYYHCSEADTEMVQQTMLKERGWGHSFGWAEDELFTVKTDEADGDLENSGSSLRPT